MDNLKLRRVVASVMVLGAMATQSYGQQGGNTLSFSLDECLEYAKENSITLQKAKLQLDNSKAQERQAKGAFLPTISGSVSQGVTNNTFSEESPRSSYYGSYGIDLSLTLYNGGKNRALYQQSELSSQIASLEVNEYSNSLEVSITEIFIEILYAKEQITVAQSTLKVAEQNERRGVQFLEAGTITEVDLAQLQSSTASARYDVVTAQSQLSNLNVALKHLLEISQDVTLSVKEPDLTDAALLQPIPTVSEVYQVALGIRPEIAASKLSIESAQLESTIARSGALPKLSFSAGTGINHNSSSSFTFSNQLRNNFSTSAGVSLSVPIFSNYSNKTAMILAKNSLKTASLSLTESEKVLYQTIETLSNNAITSQAIYGVSQSMLEAAEKSMNLTTEQYNLGMKNIIELLTEQDNYNQTSQEFLINKYKLILNKALLNYYKTNIIKL